MHDATLSGINMISEFPDELSFIHGQHIHFHTSHTHI